MFALVALLAIAAVTGVSAAKLRAVPSPFSPNDRVFSFAASSAPAFATNEAAAQHLVSKLRHHKERLPELLAHVNVSTVMRGDVYPLGIYYATVGIGNPPQFFKVALDTGSGTLIVPDKNCNGCAPSASRFDHTKSRSIKPVRCDASGACDNYCGFAGSAAAAAQCTFSNSYETCNLMSPNTVCTIAGPVWEDEFWIAGLHARAAFGAIQSQTPFFQQLMVIDGILGLAGSTSFHEKEPVPALAAAGMIANRFALCFANSTTGRFMLGGAAPNTFDPSNVQWIPLSGEYAIGMSGIAVGGVSVPFTAQDIILDSGTNVLLLDSDSLSAVQGALTQCSSCAHVNSIFNGGCFNFTSAELAAYPPIELQFNGATLTMPPETYLVPHPGHFGARCLGILSTGYGGMLIIGDTTMFSYTMIIDRDAQQVGFSPVNRKGCGAAI